MKLNRNYKIKKKLKRSYKRLKIKKCMDLRKVNLRNPMIIKAIKTIMCQLGK